MSVHDRVVEYRRQLVAVIEASPNRRVACREAGIHPSTFYRWRTRPQPQRRARSWVDHEVERRIVSEALENLKFGLEQTQMILDPRAVGELVDQIGNARRISIVAEGPAQPAAHNLVNFLEQGGFPVHMTAPGLAGLARTIHVTTGGDLLIAFDIAGEAPYIPAALRELRGKGVPTAAIVGSPSLASARSATHVLAARANPDLGISFVCIEAIIYVLVRTLRQRYTERYEGSERAVANLTSLLQ